MGSAQRSWKDPKSGYFPGGVHAKGILDTLEGRGRDRRRSIPRLTGILWAEILKKKQVL